MIATPNTSSEYSEELEFVQARSQALLAPCQCSADTGEVPTALLLLPHCGQEPPSTTPQNVKSIQLL